MWKAPGCLCFYSCPQIGAMAAVPWNFGSQTTAAVFTNEFIHQDRRYKPCQAPCVCVRVIHSSAVVDVCICLILPPGRRERTADKHKANRVRTSQSETGGFGTDCVQGPERKGGQCQGMYCRASRVFTVTWTEETLPFP